MNLIAIDPGRTTGWASFGDGVLVRCGANQREVVFSSWSEHADEMFRVRGKALAMARFLVLIELPRWYPHDHSDVNDLIDLAVQVGEVKGFYESQGCTVELVWPRTWKGNVKKEIMTERILNQLTVDELRVVPLRPRAKTPDHNTVDAIGLGLWKLGRLR